jgi:hypothetical protein
MCISILICLMMYHKKNLKSNVLHNTWEFVMCVAFNIMLHEKNINKHVAIK